MTPNVVVSSRIRHFGGVRDGLDARGEEEALGDRVSTFAECSIGFPFGQRTDPTSSQRYNHMASRTSRVGRDRSTTGIGPGSPPGRSEAMPVLS